MFFVENDELYRQRRTAIHPHAISSISSEHVSVAAALPARS